MSQNLVTVSLAVPASAVGSLYAYAATLLGSSVSPTLSNTSAGSASSLVGDAGASSTQASHQASPSNAGAEAAGNENAGKKDAAGTVFDPARHTGSIVKSGLWRMKTGMARPEHEGENSPSYVNPNAAGSASGNAGSASGTQGGGTTAPVVDEEDEFAQFAAAANNSAPAARNWTDADLSKLCNQAAQAKNDPAPVKAIIAKYVPQGQQQHSKSIPAEQREAFARDVEQTIGIQYAG